MRGGGGGGGAEERCCGLEEERKGQVRKGGESTSVVHFLSHCADSLKASSKTSQGLKFELRCHTESAL